MPFHLHMCWWYIGDTGLAAAATSSSHPSMEWPGLSSRASSTSSSSEHTLTPLWLLPPLSQPDSSASGSGGGSGSGSSAASSWHSICDHAAFEPPSSEPRVESPFTLSAFCCRTMSRHACPEPSRSAGGRQSTVKGRERTAERPLKTACLTGIRAGREQVGKALGCPGATGDVHGCLSWRPR